MAPGRRAVLALGASLFLVPILDLVGVGMIYPILLYFQGGEAAIRAAAGPLAGIVRALDGVGIAPSLGPLLGVFGGFMVARVAAEYWTQVLAARVGDDALANLRNEGIAAFVRAEIPFHVSCNTSDLANVMVVETKRAAGIVPAIVSLAASAGLAAVYGAIAVIAAPWLVAMALPTVAFAYFFYRRNLAPVAQLGKETTRLSRRMMREFYEVLRGIRLVKLRSAEKLVEDRLTGLMQESVDNAFLVRKINARVAVSTQPIVMVGLVAILYIAHTYLKADLALLGVIVFAAYRMIPQVTRIASAWLSIASNTASLDAFDEMLVRASSAPPLASAALAPGRLVRGLGVQDMSFAYRAPTGPVPAIRNVSFDIAVGQMVGIVGKSGSGKSTLVDLLARFHDPDSGRILYDSTDLRELSLPAYRRSVALVTQDTLMFDDTIRANLQFGIDRTLDEVRLRDVLEQAHCLEFVARLPAGLDTEVGERGVRLSGGQRQRLAFARALVQEPQMLILDEPTSALDSESEAAIQATLERLHGKVTTVVVAHRLATIRRCDSILVLEDGALVETGRHDELVQKGGAYARLFALQANL
ncbi:unnamed protein product [Phaeothamnion confervicola]